MTDRRVLWLDLMNPSDVLFFRPIMSRLNDVDFRITLRDRAETISLAKMCGIEGRIVGRHHTDRLRKYLGAISRYAKLTSAAGKYDVGMSFEGGLTVAVGRIRRRPSLLFCDNDLKLFQKRIYLQDLENSMKLRADKIVIPSACYDSFAAHTEKERLVKFDGYKEDVYIGDFKPDPGFSSKLPYKRYVVLRPEALDSGYVERKMTLVPELLELLLKAGSNVVYLPRESYDYRPPQNPNVFMPHEALNGLDLCYHSEGVITGSGTLAREAACMGKPAVSFFPGEKLLSVDSRLIEEGRMIHSRDPRGIVDYVLSKAMKGPESDFQRSAKVLSEVVDITNGILRGL